MLCKILPNALSVVSIPAIIFTSIFFGIGLYLNNCIFDITICQASPPYTKSTYDVYINDLQRGIIMKSADGSCWRVTVSNAGVLMSTLVDCPL